MADPIEVPEGEEIPVTPPVTPPVAPPTPKAPAPVANSPLDIASEINKALDARESSTAAKAKDIEWRAGIEGMIDDLSKPKKRKWYEPWTLFSGVM